MASKVKDTLVADIRSLVRYLTEFDETDENFNLCETYALSNILHHKYLSVDSHNVRRSITGIADKLFIHGHLEQSQQFSTLINKFLNATWFKDSPQSDVQWALLSFLLNLSNKPTTNLKPVKPSVPPKEPEENFDWGTYLKEGNENFFDKFGDDTLSDPFEFSESEVSYCQDENAPTVAEVVPDLCKTSDTEIIKKKEIVAESVDAENWLRENLQHSWWSANEINETVVSKFPAANLSKLWQGNSLEIIDGSCDTATTCTISEYKVMREILFMLHIPSSTCIFQEENERFLFRKNITIPSLTKLSLHRYLEIFCKYFAMVYELRKFLDCVNPDIKCQSQKVPHTLEAYATAVREFLIMFWEFLVPIEVKVTKQDSINTLYLLYLDVEPKLRELQVVYDIHVRATSEWMISPNWLISTRLLSVLYSAATTAVDESQSSLFLGLFLKSFGPYLDIIHTWLVEGRFEDWRQEFIIARNEEVPIDSWDMWESGFLIHPYFVMLNKAVIEPLPLLKNVSQKILHAGKSIEMLKQLNRHAEFSKLAKGKDSLYAELLYQMEEKLNGVYSELKEIPIHQNQTESFESIAQTQHVSVNSLTSLVEDPLANRLLLKARDYVFKVPCDIDNAIITDENSDVLSRIIGHVSEGSFPIKPIIEQVFTYLMEDRHQAACLLLKNILQNDYNVLVHLSLVKEIFLIGSGDMQRFCSHIFQETEKKFPWANSVALTTQLENCVDERYPNHSSRFSIVVNNRAQTVLSIDSMDDITIKYSIEWPMTLILSSENMEMYNAVFQFLMKVKWAVWALEQLRFSSLDPRRNDGDLDGSYERKKKLLWLLRFWLLHSVGSVHSYLMGQVLLSLGLQLEQDLEAACDLDTLIKVHNDYVQKVYSHCLQPKNNDIIKTAILQLATLALKLREVWIMGVEIVSEELLLKMGETYLKYHWFLGSVLQNSVDSQYNPQNNIYQLPSKSKTSIPSGFSSPLRFSFSDIAWQVGPPSGFPETLPPHLEVFMQNDIWDDNRRPRTFPAADLLNLFLDSYLKFSHTETKQNCLDEKYFFHLPSKGLPIVKGEMNNVTTLKISGVSSTEGPALNISDIANSKVNLITTNESVKKMKMISEKPKQKSFIKSKTKFKTVCNSFQNKCKSQNINLKRNDLYIPTPLVYTSSVFVTKHPHFDINLKKKYIGLKENRKYLSEILCFDKNAHEAENLKCKCTKVCNFVGIKCTSGRTGFKYNDVFMIKSRSEPCITFRKSESTEQLKLFTDLPSRQRFFKNNNYRIDMHREKQNNTSFCCRNSNMLKTINLNRNISNPVQSTSLTDGHCNSSQEKEELSAEKCKIQMSLNTIENIGNKADTVKCAPLPPIKTYESDVNTESNCATKIPRERWKSFYNTNCHDCYQSKSLKNNHFHETSKRRSQKIFHGGKGGPGICISNLGEKTCGTENTAVPVDQKVDCILPPLSPKPILNQNKSNGATKKNKRFHSCTRNSHQLTNLKTNGNLSVESSKNSKGSHVVPSECTLSPFACEALRANKSLCNKFKLEIDDQLYDQMVNDDSNGVNIESYLDKTKCVPNVQKCETQTCCNIRTCVEGHKCICSNNRGKSVPLLKQKAKKF